MPDNIIERFLFNVFASILNSLFLNSVHLLRNVQIYTGYYLLLSRLYYALIPTSVQVILEILYRDN